MNEPDRSPERLFVYECKGPGYPRLDPASKSYLGLWPEPPFYYLFFSGEAAEAVSSWLDRHPSFRMTGTYHIEYNQWREPLVSSHRVGPFSISTGPGARDRPGSGGAIELRLNPGLVFGSGLHPTTRGCLLAIAEFSARYPIRNAIDLGTGTGILAIACALIGVRKIIAVDCNPLAARIARENVRINAVEGAVDVVAAADPAVFRSPMDLLIMNIEWPVQKKILENMDLEAFKMLILSGFFRSDPLEWHRGFPGSHRILSQLTIEDWTTLVLKACPDDRDEKRTFGP